MVKRPHGYDTFVDAEVQYSFEERRIGRWTLPYRESRRAAGQVNLAISTKRRVPQEQTQPSTRLQTHNAKKGNEGMETSRPCRTLPRTCTVLRTPTNRHSWKLRLHVVPRIHRDAPYGQCRVIHIVFTLQCRARRAPESESP